VVLEVDDLLAEDVLRTERFGLTHQRLHQVPPTDRREAGDVVDGFLGVQRAHLSARLLQRVQDGDAQPAETAVVGGVEAGRSGADDGEVGGERSDRRAGGHVLIEQSINRRVKLRCNTT
jgi:hypothetical protein